MQRWGVIGVGGRGTYLMQLALGIPEVEITAVCDINEGNLKRAQDIVEGARKKRPAGYSKGPHDYRTLLARDDVDAVVIATPMLLHGEMAIEAMKAGKHVLSEVAAAYTLDECWGIVDAAKETGRTYMLAENCCYYQQALMMLNMVRQGLFGDLTYAECGYVHDCRSLLFQGDGTLTWRGEMARDLRGNVYPTHSLGPVAQWLGINRGDRLVSLTAAETPATGAAKYARDHFGPDHPASKIRFALGDSSTSILRTAKGVVIDLRFDMCSSRPHPSTTYFTLQGTKASFEDRLGTRIWAEGRSKDYAWEDLSKYAAEFEHPLWKQWSAEAAQSGHGGADFFVIRQFHECLRDGTPPPITACDAAAWSCVMPLSRMSVERGGAPMEVPDFTRGKWQKA